VRDVVAIDGGHTIVVSTQALHSGDGKLFVYDTASQGITRQFAPVPGSPDTGSLMEAGAHQIVGILRAPAVPGKPGTSSSIVYRADVQTGQVLFRRIIPGRAFAGPTSTDFLAADRRLVRGPDGCGWLFVDDTLMRIHPEDGRPESVLKGGPAGRLLFLGADLYIYNGGRQYFGGFRSIKRIRNILIGN